MTNMWLIGMEAIGNATFDGSDSSNANLYSLINKGAFADKQGDGAYEMMTSTERPIYARLIPMAWSYDNDDPPRNPSGVFIVDSATACKKGDACPSNVPGFPSGGLSDYMTTDAARKTCHCYQDNMYYLVQLVGEAQLCEVGPTGCSETNVFTTPPGLDDLDGTKWGGLTLAMFVEG